MSTKIENILQDLLAKKKTSTFHLPPNTYFNNSEIKLIDELIVNYNNDKNVFNRCCKNNGIILIYDGILLESEVSDSLKDYSYYSNIYFIKKREDNFRSFYYHLKFKTKFISWMLKSREKKIKE